MRYFVSIDGVSAGPYDHLQLLQLFQAGVITDSTQCHSATSAGTTADWQKLSEKAPSIVRPMPESDHLARVRVADLDMRFLTMVFFMVKWIFASIPAAIVVFVVAAMFSGILSGILAGLSAR